jgi:hypothetical protein
MTLKLSAEQYKTIESKINLTGDEDYVVVVQRRHGKATFGVHVFERQPSTKEMVAYEETASRVKYRGSRAEVEGSAILATKNLYDTLIARAYDIQVGRTLHEMLDRGQAKVKVTDLGKREAIREFLGSVAGLTSLNEDDGKDENVGQFGDEAE